MLSDLQRRTGPQANNSTEAAVKSRLTWQVVTPEYPPDTGGVSGYTAELVSELRRAGDRVHVWCPAAEAAAADAPDVHRSSGHMSVGDLIRLDAALNRMPGTHDVLVQWVPHGYGYRSMNLPFCVWVWLRSRRDRIQLVVHEPFLSFREGTWRQDTAAIVHRAMIVLLLRAASRVWVSTPLWHSKLRPFFPGRTVPVEWLPVVSNIAVSENKSEVRRIRNLLAPDGEFVIGHFGAFSPPVTNLLDSIVPELASSGILFRIVLMGSGSEEYGRLIRERLVSSDIRISATGQMPASGISHTIQACDILLQPFPDGVSARRSSVMAALAHGVPLVTNAGKSTEPCWAERGAVNLVPSTGPGAFRQCIVDLALRPELRADQSRQALAFYRQNFHVSVIARRLRSTVLSAGETPC